MKNFMVLTRLGEDIEVHNIEADNISTDSGGTLSFYNDDFETLVVAFARGVWLTVGEPKRTVIDVTPEATETDRSPA